MHFEGLSEHGIVNCQENKSWNIKYKNGLVARMGVGMASNQLYIKNKR